jgi:hypothetical protein
MSEGTAAKTRLFFLHCEERSDEAIQQRALVLWIASLSLSSGAHSLDPLARNDGCLRGLFPPPAKTTASNMPVHAEPPVSDQPAACSRSSFRQA